MAAWLAGVGVGGWLGGYPARRAVRPERWLASIVGTFALLGPTGIVLLRCARGWLGVGPGEYVPIAAMFWLSGLFVSPLGLLVGAAFPLACRVARVRDESAQIGWVYWVESAGSLAGGLGFTFLLVGRVNATVVAAGCALCLLTAAGWLVWGTGARTVQDGTSEAIAAARGPRPSHPPLTVRRTLGRAIAVSAILIISGAAMGLADRLDRWSIRQRWHSFAPGVTLRCSLDSRYQNLALGWREGQFELYGNGQPAAVFPEPTGLRWPIQTALCQHPDPRRVLLLGGGAEGLLAEVLTHRSVERVDHVELDPAVLDLVGPHLSARDRQALQDHRVNVVHQDVRRFVHRARSPYDLIIGRLGPPASALAARLYTLDFYRHVADILTEKGVFVFETQTSPGELRGESVTCTGSIYWTLRCVFAEVLVGWGPRPLIFACKEPGVLTTDPNLLGQRLARRGVSADHFAPEDFLISDQLDTARVRRRRAELDAITQPAISTDLHPRIYLLWMQRWEQQIHERSSRHLEKVEAADKLPRTFGFAQLDRRGLSRVGLGGVALTVVWLAWRRFRREGGGGLATGVVLWSVASTGFVTMAVEVVLLFAYQSLSGYVYEQVGALVGVFMLGLVVGSGGVNRVLARRQGGPWHLVGIDLGMAGLVAASGVVLRGLGSIDSEWVVALVVYGLIGVAGLLGGAVFPLAGRVHMTLDRRTARTASAVEAADHIGASIGALLTGMALVPVIGIAATMAVLAVLKIASAVGVALCGGTRRQGDPGPLSSSSPSHEGTVGPITRPAERCTR